MPAPLDDVQLHLVRTLDELWACARWAGERREGPLCADTESEGLSPYHHRMRLVQLGDLRQGWAFPDHWSGAAVELMSKAPHLLFHNRPYDERVLRRWTGYTIPHERTEDTLTAGHICDSLKLAGLKPRATQEVDPRAALGDQLLHEGMARNGWTWATVPLDWEPFWTYSALDPVLAAHLWQRFAPHVTGRYREAYDLEKAVTRISAQMMDTGMMIDIPFIEDAMRRVSDYHRTALAYLGEAHGIKTVNSGAQVMAALNAAGIPTRVWTNDGRPSIGKEALAFYMANYPGHRDLLQTIKWCRKAGDIQGKYLQKFLDLQIDSIMHYTINTCRARTSRQSVTDPPMQTFDRDEPIIRGSFRPRPGHALISIDADQIEMRMTAHFSKDPNLIQDFLDADASGQSFFVLAASRIFGEEVSKKDQRYSRTKNASYGQVYGAGLDRAAVTAGVPVEVMQPVYSGFQQRYPRVGALMNRLIREGKAGGRPYAEAIDGRKLYVRRGHEYAILNTMVQGSAAIVLKRGLVNLDAAGLGPYLRLTIHDEVLLEAPAGEAGEVLRAAEKVLTDRDSFAVPITWSGSILKERWAKV